MPPTRSDTDVLIVGAGPTGLVLALFLTKQGVRVRIVDRAAAPGTTSRALVMHARTLEFYDQVGIASAAVERGLHFGAVNMWLRGRYAARAQFDDLGEAFSRYSFILIYPQDEQERALETRLAQLGVHVERDTVLQSFEVDDTGVRAQIATGGSEPSICRARYLAGCDGTRSTVREQLGVGFSGGDYANVFYVADIEGSGTALNGEVNVALDDADFVIVFPMKEPGTARLVGVVTPGAAGHGDKAGLKWDDVSKRAIEHLKLHVTNVRWFSTYHVHHRVADSFRRGPVFLLGDAAHVHSPVGGQGMNTGIGDAVNLAWKIAGVIHRRLDPSVLDTYEVERMAFAKRLVATTDRAFEFVIAPGRLARFVRLNFFPRFLAQAFRVRAVRRFMFRTISQIGIAYPESRLSEGRAGAVRGGDRLPWVGWRDTSGRPCDNYQYFSMLDWQVHCYGTAPAAIRAACDRHGLTLRQFAWRQEMHRIGFRQDAIYLVRPDEHVALAAQPGDAAALDRYVARVFRTGS